MYDYRKAVKEDVANAICEEYDIMDAVEDRDEFIERLYDDLWVDDSVTGNASGSYTFNTYKAEENLNHNWDLLCEAAEEFGIEPKLSEGYENGAEYWDVTIRCYLLRWAIDEVVDDLLEEVFKNADELL